MCLTKIFNPYVRIIVSHVSIFFFKQNGLVQVIYHISILLSHVGHKLTDINERMKSKTYYKI